MVEVFKTDVRDPDLANLLVGQIHQCFTTYSASFDLEDCDRILRVECKNGAIQPSPVIALLAAFGFAAQVLPDDVPAAERWFAGHSKTIR